MVEEYERNIPLFLINNKMGKVHSVFKNGMNIQMGGRIFFIGTTKNGLLPFGIHLKDEAVHYLLSAIHPPSTVIWNDITEEFFFESAQVYVNLHRGTPFSNKINKCKGPPSSLHIKEMIKVLAANGERTGLDIDVEQFSLDYLTKQKNEMNNETIREIYCLMNAIHSNNCTEIERVIRYFLGRGKGLTPSGDDHLVGLLAIHTLFNSFNPIFIQTLHKIIEHESVTTDIGKEYLLYALKGEFSSSIVNILNSLPETRHPLVFIKHLQQLITMGHSSGVDTAFGMLIGLMTLKNH